MDTGEQGANLEKDTQASEVDLNSDNEEGRQRK